jgi:hypothetical protein
MEAKAVQIMKFLASRRRTSATIAGATVLALGLLPAFASGATVKTHVETPHPVQTHVVTPSTQNATPPPAPVTPPVTSPPSTSPSPGGDSQNISACGGAGLGSCDTFHHQETPAEEERHLKEVNGPVVDAISSADGAAQPQKPDVTSQPPESVAGPNDAVGEFVNAFLDGLRGLLCPNVTYQGLNDTNWSGNCF